MIRVHITSTIDCYSLHSFLHFGGAGGVLIELPSNGGYAGGMVNPLGVFNGTEKRREIARKWREKDRFTRVLCVVS